MNDRWESVPSDMRRHFQWWRLLLSGVRWCQLVVPVLLLLAGLRLGWRYGWISSGVLAVTGLIIITAGGAIGTWFRKRFTLTDCEALRILVDRDDRWEPLRVLVLRSRRHQFHPHFIDEISEQITELHDRATPFSNLRTVERALTVAVCLGVLGLAGLGWTGSVISPGTSPEPLRLSVSTDHQLSGDTVEVRVADLGRTQQPRLVLEQSGQQRTVRPEWSENGWRWRSFPLEQSTSIHARRGDRRSAVHRVSVVAEPVLELQIESIQPPVYTGQSTRRDVEATPDVLPGSELRLVAEANRSMEQIRIEGLNTGRRHEIHQQSNVTRSFRIDAAERFVATAVDTFGFRADSSTVTVNPQKDAAPRVELLEPDPDEKVEGSGLLPVRARYNDDFGLSGARLTYWRREDAVETRAVQVPSGQSEGELYGQLDRSALDLMTGDTFQFTFTVADNDRVNGPKTTTAGPFTIQVYTWEEMMKQRENQFSGEQNQLSQMNKTVKDLQSELEEMARNQGSEDWEVSRKLQQAQKALERQKEQLQQAQERINQYEEGGEGLSRESLEKLQSIQKMAEEYGMESLDKARESLSKAVQDQMEEGEFSPEDLRYSRDQLESFERDIDRMHEFMEQAEPALKMDEMARTLQSMSEEQTSWSDNGEQSEKSQRQLERQAEQWEWMEENLEQLAEQTEGDVKRQLQELSEQLSEQDMAEQARSLSESSSPDRQAMQDYREKTRRARNQMRRTQKQQSNRMNQQQQNLRGMLVNYWTEWYDAFQVWSDQLRQLDVPPRFAARYDASMRPLNDLIERTTELRRGLSYLGELTRQMGGMSPSFPREVLQTIPEHRERMSSTLEQIRNRRLSRAVNQSDNLMAKQARLIEQLLDWQPQSSSGGSSSQGGSDQPSLSQLLSQQRQLTQSMMPMLGSGSVSDEMARQLLQQQKMIRQGMQKLAQSQQQNEEILGDLESITNQMEQSEQKMADREFDQTLESQQETILERLEQATKSLTDSQQKQEQVQERRTAEPGKSDTAPFDRSEYQAVIEQIQPDFDQLDPSDREAVLRFYRFWFRESDTGARAPQ